LVAEANPRHFHEAPPAMNDPMLPLPGLSSVAGKTVVAKFDGGLLSSDGGVLALREVEKRLRVADRFAACIKDPRAPRCCRDPTGSTRGPIEVAGQPSV
jgi:Transposase DDE domain group 1